MKKSNKTFTTLKDNIAYLKEDESYLIDSYGDSQVGSFWVEP